MNISAKRLIQGLGIGIGGTYFWDPRMGRQRRARLSDQATRLKHESREFLNDALEDLRNRSRGFAIESRKQLFPRENRRPDIVQDHWLPGTRLVVGTGAGLMLARGLFRRGFTGLIYTLVGAAGLLRAIRNQPLKQAVQSPQQPASPRTSAPVG
jgi:hypothetical protein